jgi:phosphatidylglycerophosphate synthase
VETVFVETPDDRHLRRIGGLTALERKLREVAKQGAKRAVIAGERVDFERPLPIAIDYVAAGTPPPEGARVERADMIAGVELVDAEAAQRAEWALIRTMNKAHEGPVDALINWRFSMRITRALSHRSLAVTPNHVTIAAILVGLGAAVLVATGQWAWMALGGVLLEVNSILDSVDGELARLRFQYSKVGQWLDNLSDDIVDNAFILACGYAIGGTWWWLAVGAAGGRVLVAISTYIWVYVKTGTGDVFAFRWWFESEKASAAEVYSPKSLLTWLRSFGRRDTFVFVWMLALACKLPHWIVVHGLVIAAINVSLLVLHFTVFRGRRAA